MEICEDAWRTPDFVLHKLGNKQLAKVEMNIKINIIQRNGEELQFCKLLSDLLQRNPSTPQQIPGYCLKGNSILLFLHTLQLIISWRCTLSAFQTTHKRTLTNRIDHSLPQSNQETSYFAVSRILMTPYNGDSSSTLKGDKEKTTHTSNCSHLQFNSKLTQRYLMKRRICTWDLLTHLLFEPVFIVIFRMRTTILMLPPSLDTLWEPTMSHHWYKTSKVETVKS